jgi:DNA-binding response OmpR family regulator
MAAELLALPIEAGEPSSTLSLRLRGLFVPTERPSPVGSVLTLQLSWFEGAAPIQTLARVQAVVEADPALGRAGGMQLELVGVWGERAAEQVTSYLNEAASAEAQRAALTGAGVRVLVVDDSEPYRQSAAQVMREAGFEVVTANNGFEALSLALKHQPHVVLTDVTMPGMDGWQLLRMIRARPTLRRTPVVFCTDLASDEERLRGYQLGVDDYLHKPFTPVELIARIERVLERAHESEQAVANGMRGDLSKVSLTSLLSFAELERRTGILQLLREGETATLHLRDGAVVQIDLVERYAQLPPLRRFFHVLDWEHGRFELTDTRVFAADSIQLSTSFALLEYARQRDEAAAR